MNKNKSPEFYQVLFKESNLINNKLKSLFTYFVIYLAFMEKYNKGEMITLFGSTKYMIPYSVAIAIIFVVVISAWYIIGLPIGIGTFPGVVYGAYSRYSRITKCWKKYII